MVVAKQRKRRRRMKRKNERRKENEATLQIAITRVRVPSSKFSGEISTNEKVASKQDPARKVPAVTEQAGQWCRHTTSHQEACSRPRFAKEKKGG